jgi:hypothetical protein
MHFLRHLIHCMSDVNAVLKQAGTIPSDGINNYILYFWCSFYGLRSILNCHTEYVHHVSLDNVSYTILYV